MSKFMIRAAGAALAVIGLVGCVTRADIEEIKKGQEEIKTKLAAIERGGGRGQRPDAAQAAAGRPDPAKTYAVAVGDAATKGPEDAWVTIVEVSDFQCPFCNRVGPTIKALEDKYKSDLRVAFKHNPLPFHQRALPAALAAECARDQNKFWEMHDVMFQNQRALEDADLEKYAGQIGLDAGKFKSCYSEQKYKGRVEEQQKSAVAMGARGTPAFFINGRFLSGAQPQTAFEQVIDEELKKAKESGVSKGDYYAKSVVEKGAKSL